MPHPKGKKPPGWGIVKKIIRNSQSTDPGRIREPAKSQGLFAGREFFGSAAVRGPGGSFVLALTAGSGAGFGVSSQPQKRGAVRKRPNAKSAAGGRTVMSSVSVE
jgi:hypothetical protein